jgi:endonuclease/exonuclease/phosphatase family metal-dependent hydrolase
MTHGLRVASYNIRKCVGLDRRRDPDRVLDVIAGIEADVVALQESDKRLGERPATLDRDRIAELTGLEAVDLDQSGVSLGWHGNALLLHPEIVIEAVERLELPGLEPRGAVLVEARRGESAFRIVAAHLGLTRQYRRRQLRVIVDAAHAAGADIPTMVMGDFNEWRMDRGLEPLGKEFAIHAPGLSFHAARPVAALDRIALNPSLELRDAGVVQTASSRIASDHLPIWADVRLR